MYDFDQVVDRKGTGCLKWDQTKTYFGKGDLLPLWIADMDFPTAPGIQQKLQERLDQGVFGYATLSPRYYQSVVSWMSRRHQYLVQPEWITYTAGVVPALYMAVEAVTDPGDQVMILTPVYGPFFRSIQEQGRELVSIPLDHDGQGYYRLDLAAMEAAVTDRTKALLFCSPHNPVGRVWSWAELEQVVDFCRRHNLVIIDDEIHNDLVYTPGGFITLGRLGPEAECRSIICTAITKTFNLADLQVSNILIPDPTLRERFQKVVRQYHVTPHAFSEPALLGAYEQAEDWLDELLVYLEGNIDFFCGELNRRSLPLSCRKPEGTYLVWVDCRGLGLPDAELQPFFVEQCGLAVNPGTDFGPDWGQYVRFNLACPRATISKALDRIEAALTRR